MALPGIRLPALRQALETHQTAQKNAGNEFKPSDLEIEQLNTLIETLGPNPTVQQLDECIFTVWGARETCPQKNYFQDNEKAIKSFRSIIEQHNGLMSLYKITEPALRAALLNRAAADSNFKPDAAEVTLFNKAIAVLEDIEAFAVDTAVTDSFTKHRFSVSPDDYFQQNAQNINFSKIIEQHKLLYPLNSIINPLLRQALFDFGATVNLGFRPTIDDVRALNAALADLGPDATAGNIDEAIQKRNSFKDVDTHGPAADFIQKHPRSAEILEEITRLGAIKAKFTKFTPSSAAASPVSMKLITALPQEKQKELLADEGKKLKKLLGARELHDIRVAAREAGLTNENFRDAGFGIGDNPLEQMAEEQKAHRLYRTIHNAKIAEILGSVAVQGNNLIILNDDQIKNLNTYLISQKANDLELDALLAALPLLPAQQILETALQKEFASIKAEHQKNIRILTALEAAAAAQPPVIQKRELCKVLARIEKIEANLVDSNDIDPLLNAINTAADYDAFKKALAAAPLLTIVEKLKNWESIITPETFQYLKQQKIKQNLGSDNQSTRTDELKNQQKEFEALNADLKKFSKANSQISDELERLSKLNAFDWLAPEIGGIAIRRAQEVKEQFEIIADKCDAICAGLEGMRQKLQTLLDGMPTGNDEHPEGVFTRNRVKSLRKDIESKIDDINTMLNKYQDVHFHIYGDPLIRLEETESQKNPWLKTQREGVLNVIKERATPQAPAAEQPANCHGFQRKELKAATRAESIKTVLAEYEGRLNNDGNVEIEGNAQVEGGLFGDLGAPAPGEEVFYAKNAVALAGKKVVSASGYTETRGKPVTTEAPKGGKQQHQQINLKVAQWPKADPKAPDTDDEKKLLKEAKCKFAVDMTVRLLAGLGALPSPKNQIVLRGSDPEQLSMLWTALMELGDAHPDYKFDASCIRVESMHFNPKDHKKGILGYGKNSAYKQYFATENNPLGLMKKEIKQFYETSYAKGGSERAVKNRQDISTLFKKLLNDSKTAEGVEAVTQHTPPKPK